MSEYDERVNDDGAKRAAYDKGCDGPVLVAHKRLEETDEEPRCSDAVEKPFREDPLMASNLKSLTRCVEVPREAQSSGTSWTIDAAARRCACTCD